MKSALANGTGTSDTPWSADFMLAEGYYGASSRALGSNGLPIPGAEGHCSFVVDRTPPSTTSDNRVVYPTNAVIDLTPDDALSQVATTEWTLDGARGSGRSLSTGSLGWHT